MRQNPCDEQYLKMVKRIKGSCLLALPQSAAKILELSRNPENGPREYAAAISADLGLTSQILRFVNSSYFGFRNKITTVQMALSLVYGRTIKNFVLWNAVFSILPDPRCGPFQLKKICQDSLRRGVFARMIGGFFPEQDQEELFIRGLFQDMAIPILAQCWPKEYEEILTKRSTKKIRLSILEQEYFGWDHALAGAFLADEWGFDEDFCNSIANHVHPGFDVDFKNCTDRELRDAILGLSGLLPSVVDETWDEADTFFNIYFRLLHQGMPYPDVLFKNIEKQVSDLLNITQLTLEGYTLIDFHKQWLKTFE